MNDHNHQSGQGHGSLHPHGIEEPPVSSVRGIPLVELVEVSSSYGTTPALTNVSLKIWPGQFMAIVGPNGGGKTTLLRTILGLYRRRRGKFCCADGNQNVRHWSGSATCRNWKPSTGTFRSPSRK